MRKTPNVEYNGCQTQHIYASEEDEFSEFQNQPAVQAALHSYNDRVSKDIAYSLVLLVFKIYIDRKGNKLENRLSQKTTFQSQKDQVFKYIIRNIVLIVLRACFYGKGFQIDRNERPEDERNRCINSQFWSDCWLVMEKKEMIQNEDEENDRKKKKQEEKKLQIVYNKSKKSIWTKWKGKWIKKQPGELSDKDLCSHQNNLFLFKDQSQLMLKKERENKVHQRQLERVKPLVTLFCEWKKLSSKQIEESLHKTIELLVYFLDLKQDAIKSGQSRVSTFFKIQTLTKFLIWHMIAREEKYFKCQMKIPQTVCNVKALCLNMLQIWRQRRQIKFRLKENNLIRSFKKKRNSFRLDFDRILELVQDQKVWARAMVKNFLKDIKQNIFQPYQLTQDPQTVQRWKKIRYFRKMDEIKKMLNSVNMQTQSVQLLLKRWAQFVEEISQKFKLEEQEIIQGRQEEYKIKVSFRFYYIIHFLVKETGKDVFRRYDTDGRNMD